MPTTSGCRTETAQQRVSARARQTMVGTTRGHERRAVRRRRRLSERSERGRRRLRVRSQGNLFLQVSRDVCKRRLPLATCMLAMYYARTVRTRRPLKPSFSDFQPPARCTCGSRSASRMLFEHRVCMPRPEERAKKTAELHRSCRRDLGRASERSRARASSKLL